ncbi:alpha/beta hydrolase [Candidatus Microgenomates bacterium]|nr:MAG: alpha/beta hydrolase [Candidatus Microgenomates bacterium]
MYKIPIVILPGWMLGQKRFQSTSEELKKNGFRSVYTVDFPGFEEGEEIFKPWDLSDYVGFLEAFLKQHNINKAIFICHSFGGRVGLKLIAQKPQLAAALILTGTPGYRFESKIRFTLLMVIVKLGKAFLELPPFSAFQDVLRNVFYVLSGARDLRRVKGFMKQTFINIVEEELEPYMKKISVPTLLLWGSDDGLVSVRIAQKMHEVISRAELRIIADSRHNVIYRNAPEFVRSVIEFLTTRKLLS